MRTGKKLTSWVLFFVMLFSVAVFPVMADEPAGNGSAPMESFSDNDLNENGIPDDEEVLGPEGIEDNSDKDHDALIKDFEFEDEEEVIDDSIQSEIYLDNSEFLTNLGLYRFSEKYYRDTVTRGEFAAMMMDLLGGEETASGSVPFGDVPTSNEYYGAIGYVYNSGLMNGVGGGNFAPEATITYVQALKTVLVALGYKDLAEVQGGYPTAYIKLGMNLKLMKNTPGDYNSPLSFENAIVLLCLAAETEVCDMLSVSDGSAFYGKNEDRLLMTVYHNIYTDRGVMTDNGRTAVNKKSTVTSEKVIIAGKELYGADEKIKDLIGQNITYYYRDKDGINTILHAFADERYNDIVTLDAHELEKDSPKFTKTCVVAKINGKIRNFKIDPYANLLYNGIFDETFTKDTMKIFEGYITLIDADKDGDYELVCVEEYMDIVVGSHVPGSNLSSMYTVNDFSSIIYKDYDIVSFRDADGNVIESKEVMKGHVLSVFKSKGGEMVRFVLSTNTANLQVTSVDVEDDSYTLYCDDKSYVLSANYSNLIKTAPHLYTAPVGGTFYDVHFNFEGKIVMMNQSFGKKQYAYLMRMGKGSGLNSNDVELLMCLETNDCVVVTAKDKITINGEKGRPASELWTNEDLFVDGKLVPQLVYVTVNGKGIMTSIETDNNANDGFLVLDPNGDGVVDEKETNKINSNISNYSIKYKPGEFSLDYYRGDGYSGPAYATTDARAIFGGVCITENTKIFLVGRNSRNLQVDDPELVQVIDYGDYVNGLIGNPGIKVYDVDLTWEAGAAVITETIPISWNLFFVDDSSYVTDAEGETKLRITGYFANGYYTFRVYDSELVTNAVKYRYPGSDGVLKKGDVLMIGRDYNGEVGSVKLFYSPQRDDNPDYNFIDVYTNNQETEKNSRLASGSVMILGHLCAVKDGRLGIFTKANPDYVPMEQSYAQLADNAADSYWVHSTNKSTAYYMFDCTDKELKKVDVNSIAGGADFEIDLNGGDGNFGTATFTNYDKNTKYFILRQSANVKIVYIVTNMN